MSASFSDVSSIDATGPGEPEQSGDDESREVAFWRERLDSSRRSNSYKKFKDDKDAAYKFYFGEVMAKNELEEWGGDAVQANLFVRSVNFMVDTTYSQDPTIRCPAKAKARSNPAYQHWSAAVEHHLAYLFEEEDEGTEIRRAFKDSIFSNLAAVELDFDRSRQLWRARWVPGELLFDPDAHGDLRRARWMAKMVQLPRYKVWQDRTFPEDVRAELRGKASFEGDTPPYSDEEGENRRDLATLWYVYTKEGKTPLKNEDDTPQLRLLVMCEGFDRWLLDVEDPCPYLDDDEFPVEIMQVDDAPGFFRGPPLWRRVSAVCKAFNWAASYHMEDMRKTATRPIGYNEDVISDPDAMKSRRHMMPVACQGSPRDAVSPLNIGAADKTILDSVNFWYDMLDKLTGIDQIARGEQGQTMTATQSQILESNSGVALSGPGKALDKFLSRVARKLGLASLYYTPQFSVYVSQQAVDQTGRPQLVTRAVSQVPVMGPMGPVVGPNGQVQTQPQVQEVPAQLTPQQVAELGLDLSDLRPGQYVLKGIDYFHGDQVAMNWPQVPFEEVKCDLAFEVEAGSSRASRRMEKQRNAQALLQTVGAELRGMALWDYYYEVLNTVVESFDLEDKDRMFPPKEVFVGAMQAQQQMMMAASAMGQPMAGAPPGPPPPQGGAPAGAAPHEFDQSKNEGKKFPVGG